MGKNMERETGIEPAKIDLVIGVQMEYNIGDIRIIPQQRF
jgi:hypothetical protein